MLLPLDLTLSLSLPPTLQALLQPLLASEKLDLFKKMMHHRNVVLERQALQMVQKELVQHSGSTEQQQGTNADSQQAASADDLKAARAAREEEMMQRALELSKKDYEKRQQEDDNEMERLMELAKQESLKMLDSLSMKGEATGDPAAGTKIDQNNSHEKESDTLPSLVTDKALIGGQEAGSSADSSQRPKTDGATSDDAAELWLQTARQEAKEQSSSGDPVVSSHTINPITSLCITYQYNLGLIT